VNKYKKQLQGPIVFVAYTHWLVWVPATLQFISLLQ